MQSLGFLPQLLAGVAESPALLEVYLALSAIGNKTALSEAERPVVMMTANRFNGGRSRMMAHSVIVQMQGAPLHVIVARRAGTVIDDCKLEALRTFNVRLLDSRVWPDEADLAALILPGYKRQAVLEVVLGLGMKLLSDYTSHIVQTPLDPEFSAQAWSAYPRQGGAAPARRMVMYLRPTVIRAAAVLHTILSIPRDSAAHFEKGSICTANLSPT